MHRSPITLSCWQLGRVLLAPKSWLHPSVFAFPVLGCNFAANCSLVVFHLYGAKLVIEISANKVGKKASLPPVGPFDVRCGILGPVS